MKAIRSYELGYKMPTIISQPVKKSSKKKIVTFKKSINNSRNYSTNINSSFKQKTNNRKNIFNSNMNKVKNENTQKCTTIKFQDNQQYIQRQQMNEDKKIRTCIPFGAMMQRQYSKLIKLNQFKQQYHLKSQQQQQQNQIKHRNQLLLTMFKQNYNTINQSSNSLYIDDINKFNSNIHHHHTFSSLQNNSSLLNSGLRNVNCLKNTFDLSPFQAAQRELQKRKQYNRKKQLSGLQRLSKQLLQKLNKQQKYDQQSNIMRQRYMSYFHSRNNSGWMNNNSGRINSNKYENKLSNTKQNKYNIQKRRQSIQKSHLHIRSKSIGCQIEKRLRTKQIKNCVGSCMKLIDDCKQVQRGQRLKRQINIFTMYSKQFIRKCQHKCNNIQKIKKLI